MSTDIDSNRILLWENEVLLEPEHLQQGHFVARMDRPWIGTPFPLEGVLVSDEVHIEWFRRRCQWVVVDLLRSDSRFTPSRGTWNRSPRAPRLGSGYLSDDQAAINVLRRARLNGEIVSEAMEMHGLLHRQAEALIRNITTGGKIDVTEARDLVASIASRLEKNVAAMVWLTRIKDVDRYTAQHCVNVAILSMGLAQALEWPRERIEMAGLSGMLHDLGKMKLDSRILNKKGRLTAEEYDHIKEHSRLGFQLLSEDERIPGRVAQAVLEHHERPDGTGYPTGCSTEVLDPLGVLVAVADAYDAITSNRPYRAARSHHEALGILWKRRGTQFDRAMVDSLIQFLGWITPGTIVRLSDERPAIVLRASHHHRLWPLVRLLEEHQGEYRIGARLDLAEYNEEHPDRRLRVAEVLTDDALGLDMRAALEREGREVAEPDAEDDASS